MKRQNKSLIINSPYAEPQEYWRYDRARREFSRARGRRPAGYLQATPQSKDFDDPGVFVPIPLANDIRARVGRWRAAGYPGVSGMTRRLLKYWSEREAEDQRTARATQDGEEGGRAFFEKRPPRFLGR